MGVPLTSFPLLVREWNHDRNMGLELGRLTQGSDKKAWWTCSKNSKHEWQATISSRTAGRGCPFCSGKRVSEDNNLEANYPQLAKEWDLQKNQGQSPADVTTGSGKKVWWICQKDSEHKWQAVISSRTSGRGCPYCSGNRASKNNSFAQAFPELAEQWHPTRNGRMLPDEFTKKSNKKVWWMCPRNSDHVWKTGIGERARGTGCPFCSHQTSAPEIRLLTELKKIFPNRQIGWRSKIGGVEVDLLIEEKHLAIEFDGRYWHKSSEERDRVKTEKLADMGYKLVRVRESPLKRLSNIDVLVSSPITKEDVDTLLIAIEKLDKDPQQGVVKRYQSRANFVNDPEYRRFLSYLPSPPPLKLTKN